MRKMYKFEKQNRQGLSFEKNVWYLTVTRFSSPSNVLMGRSPTGFQKLSISEPPTQSDQVIYLNSNLLLGTFAFQLLF